MAEPTLIESKTSLRCDQIDVTDRLRPVSAAGVATIVASLREIGQLTNPIAVRQLRRKGETRWIVLDGAHRLAAAMEMGWQDVPVRVFECTDDQARIMEIDGNLSGAELNPLDTAVFLATRKAVYERLHPETKAAVGAALVAKRWSDTSDMMSFVSVTAEKFGLSKRHIERLVAAGSRLGPDEVARLRAAPRQVTLKDLQDIAKIGAPPTRYDVVAALADGKAKTAAAALKALEAGDEAVMKDPVEEQFIALMKAWGRAGLAAKRRWIEEVFDDLSWLVMDEAEDRDALEIAELRARMKAIVE